MNTAAFRQNTEIKLKLELTITIKAGNSSTTKHGNLRFNMNGILIVKYSSAVL